MKEELETKLFQKYPKIFRQKNLPMSQTCMCWGIDCGDGWYELLDDTCACIQRYCDQTQFRTIKNKYYYFTEVYNFVINLIRHILPSRLYYFLQQKSLLDYKYPDQEKYKIDQIEATQVKEKYGGLRFYTNYYDEKIDGMIDVAEYRSIKTCEHCGSTENVTQSDGWIVTLCDKCHKERSKE